MREHAQLPAYYKYLTEKFHWDQSTTDQIEWRAIELALDRFTPPDCIRIQKIIHEWIPTWVSPGNNPSAETDRLCPSCQRHQETPEHLLRCDATTRTPLLATLCNKLATHFTTSNIDPHIYQMWWLGLTTLNHPDVHHLEMYPASFHPIYRSQSQIG